MKKRIRCVAICAAIAAGIWAGGLLLDRQQLREELIRFHVVGNSDTARDQAIKLQVRDAVLQSIKADLSSIGNVENAKAYLRESIPKIQSIANETLESAGFDGEAVVTLCREAFDTRQYDTFALPAGVYESLRIVIGEGAGRNWWCVAFPTLCLPATSEGFEKVAAGAGFTNSLSSTLAARDGYAVRFFLLDTLGTIENMFFSE